MVSNFIEKIYALKNGEYLQKSEVIEFISRLNEHTKSELIEKVQDDIDAQIRIRYSLENALPSENTKSDVRNKIIDIIYALNNISQQIIDTCEDNKNNSVGASVLSDHESRLIVLKKDLQEISEKIQDLESIKELQGDLEESNEKLIKANEKIDDATKQSKEILNQSIEVLGIFVAIITIFIGGFTEISLFGTMENLNTYKFFLYVVVTGHIMSDLIFMFVYMLGRITNKSISVSCINYQKIPDIKDKVESKCLNCCFKSDEACAKYTPSDNNKCCTLSQKLKYKYPYIYYANIFAVIVEVVLCMGWIYSDNILWIKSTMWIKIIILIAVVLLVLVFLKHFLSKNKFNS